MADESYLHLETQGGRGEDHLSLRIVHFAFRTSRKGCRCWVRDEPLAAAISAGHL